RADPRRGRAVRPVARALRRRRAGALPLPADLGPAFRGPLRRGVGRHPSGVRGCPPAALLPARPRLLPRGARQPDRRRLAQPDAARLPGGGGARRRARGAPPAVRVRPVRARRPCPAALLSGRGPAADVAAALRARAVPAAARARRVARRTQARDLAGAGLLGRSDGRLRRAVRDLALGGVKTSAPTPGAPAPGEVVEVGAPAPPARPAPPEPLEGDPSASPLPGWPWWSALVVLLGAFVLTAIGAIVVDLPAVAFGAEITSSHTPPGLTIADTFVQDLAFVAAPLLCAHWLTRAVRPWQFGLRRP